MKQTISDEEIVKELAKLKFIHNEYGRKVIDLAILTITKKDAEIEESKNQFERLEFKLFEDWWNTKRGNPRTEITDSLARKIAILVFDEIKDEEVAKNTELQSKLEEKEKEIWRYRLEIDGLNKQLQKKDKEMHLLENSRDYFERMLKNSIPKSEHPMRKEWDKVLEQLIKRAEDMGLNVFIPEINKILLGEE